MFLIQYIKKVFKMIAHQFPWSKYCRSSSIGGCAPKISTAGMFKSSTNMTHFLPIGGPYTPLRLLSSLDMMMFCSGKIRFKCLYSHIHLS